MGAAPGRSTQARRTPMRGGRKISSPRRWGTRRQGRWTRGFVCFRGWGARAGTTRAHLVVRRGAGAVGPEWSQLSTNSAPAPPEGVEAVQVHASLGVRGHMPSVQWWHVWACDAAWRWSSWTGPLWHNIPPTSRSASPRAHRGRPYEGRGAPMELGAGCAGCGNASGGTGALSSL